VLRLLRRKIDYATRPDPIRYPRSLVRSAEHVALTQEAAEKGLVLLKNDGVLPLNKSALRSVAVVGRLGAAPNLGDYGSSRVYPPSAAVVSVVDGLREALGDSHVIDGSHAELAQARSVARSADAVVMVVGFDQSDQGEYVPENPNQRERGGDREDLALKAADRELVQAMTAENPKTIVVLIGGAAITVEDWQQRAGAILLALYPGERGGAAIARILLGAVNPSGRLPFTVPRDASQLPPFDNRSPLVEYGYYHGYTAIDKKGVTPRYPFGFGLSYTTYSFSNLALDRTSAGAAGTLAASVDVTNTGMMAGGEVVQLYVGFGPSRVDRPVKLLRGFTKIFLAPGETKRVTLPVSVRDLAYFDVSSSRWVVEPADYVVLVGPSSRPSDLLSASFRVSD
jgi:beta-glucosidase